MRTLLAVILAVLPLVQAQDSRLLKSVEPQYDRYSEDLTTDFDVASASVTMTVRANGKPFTLDGSNIPLPMAVVMALKDYEFRPPSTLAHGRTDGDAGNYQVTLNVPIRESIEPVSPSAVRIRSGISKGLLIRQVRPEYSEDMRASRTQGTINLEVRISKEGYPVDLKAIRGTFALIESAYDAVKQWQWRPYLLNNEPVEVLTDIQINFALN